MRRRGLIPTTPAALLRTLVAATMLGATLGAECPQRTGPYSDNGNLELEGHGLSSRAGYLESLWLGGPVLRGERICPNVRCLYGACDQMFTPDGGVAPCVEQTVVGATSEDGCITFDRPGTAWWELEPVACPPPADGGVALATDRFSFETVDDVVVRGEQQPAIEQLARELVDGGTLVAEPTVPEWFGQPRSDLQIVEGGEAPVSVALRSALYGETVAFAAGELALADVAPTPDAVRSGDDWRLSAEDGASATLRLEHAPTPIDVATVEGRSIEDAATMALTAFYWVDPARPGFRAPAAAFAAVRDAQGRVLEGAPVEWTLVQGDLAIGNLYAILAPVPEDEAGPGRPGAWRLVSDACRLPSTRAGTATALLRARLGAFVQDLRLEWTLPPDAPAAEMLPSTSPAEDQGFLRDATCPASPACGCTAAPSTPTAPSRSAAAALTLLVLVVTARPTQKRKGRDSTAAPSSPSRKPPQIKAGRAAATEPKTPT